MANIQDIINLRRTIHRHPELANQEVETAKRVSEFIRKFSPDLELNISKTGKAFVFNGEEAGETIAFRTELDALPIQEKSHLAYRSATDEVAHLCGHDGHMAIMSGLAMRIAENPPKKGKVVILFQPAEETQQGAKDVVESAEYHFLAPNYIFALHNIPGYPKGQIILKNDIFTAASKGMTIKLTGHTSHAAEPEKGNSPTSAALEIVNTIDDLVSNKSQFSDNIFATCIFIHLGEKEFGITPGEAEMGFTLRTFDHSDMDLLTQQAEDIVETIARQHDLSISINYSEIFPPTMNNQSCIEMVEKAAKKAGLEIHQLEKPFRFSEDFAYFTATTNGAQFGIGAGENQPPLHHPGFDFPDDIIEDAIDVFFSIYEDRLC